LHLLRTQPVKKIHARGFFSRASAYDFPTISQVQTTAEEPKVPMVGEVNLLEQVAPMVPMEVHQALVVILLVVRCRLLVVRVPDLTAGQHCFHQEERLEPSGQVGWLLVAPKVLTVEQQHFQD